MGLGLLPDDPCRRLLERRRPRRSLLCPQRGDRPLLATLPDRAQDLLLPAEHGLSCGWRHAPQGKSTEDLPQLPQQPDDALENLPEEDLRPVMLWRWLLDYVAAWWTLIGQRNLGDFKAIYRARRAFLAWRHDFDTDRCFASPEEKAKLPADGRKPYSILWQYHIKGRKHFSDLP